MKYEVKNTLYCANKDVKVGQIVYDCVYHDYGLASDDTQATGLEHISVTLDPKGNYPFFTIAVKDLLPLPK